MSDVPRMRAASEHTNPVQGTVRWRPVKSLWYSGHALLGLVAITGFFSWSAFAVAGLLTAATLCFGHSVGFHRLLIHRSFRCPRWLEHLMVTAGVMVGMGGPRKVMYMHDIRDWSQRHPDCHPFYIHRSSLLRDWFWNLHCELELEHAPVFEPEPSVGESRFYRFLDRYWMLMQVPLAAVLYLAGGWTWVLWGVSGRIALSLTGHWLVGYLAHHAGQREWHVRNAAVQGYNVVGLGLITMGEAWHNNHHAFPESARLGLRPGQSDAGWWLLRVLSWLGLVHDVRLPENLPPRPELEHIGTTGTPQQPHVTGQCAATMTG